MESARNYALGTLATSLSTQSGLASTLSMLAGLGLDESWLRDHPAHLAALDVDEVAAAAASMLAPARFTGVVVGDLGGARAGAAGPGQCDLRMTADHQREPSPPAPPAGPARFTIAVPTLSRGTADRSEDLREPGACSQQWPDARVLTMDGAAGSQLDPATEPGCAPGRRLRSPPRRRSGAVLLGAVDGIDHWAVRGEVAGGGGLRDSARCSPTPTPGC